MNTKQENRLNMYLAVRDYITANTAILATLPNFTQNQTLIQNTIIQIQAISSQQSTNRTGITEGKNILKQNLVNIAVDNSKKLLAYAKIIKNTILINEIDTSERYLNRLSENNVRDACQLIYDRAQNELKNLTTYGITAATQTVFLKAITDFSASIPKTRLSATAKRQLTIQLEELFKKVDTALDEIDAVMEIIRLTQTNIYNGYKTVRRIIMSGNGKLSLKGIVKDSSTGETLHLASLNFKLSNPKTEFSTLSSNNEVDLIKKKSAAKGGFNIKHLPGGTYDVLITKAGYKDKKMTFSVADGELNLLEISLEKI